MIALPTYSGRKVAVLGLARSGSAAVRALTAAGAQVVAWDDSEARRDAHAKDGIRLANLGTGTFEDVDALILSPGIPYTHPAPHPAVTAAQRAGVGVMGDVELFATASLEAKIVGITGTNGKSTTTALIGHLLSAAGRQVQVGGNIGRPVLDLDPLGAEGIYVVELSSYQIDLAPSLVCDVAVLTNISADHLDRHGDMAGYVAVKRRIFNGQADTQAAIVGVDDPYGRETRDWLLAQGHARVVPIAVGNSLGEGVYVDNGVLHDRMSEAERLVDLQGIRSLRGAHNWQNAAAAYAAARVLGLEADGIEMALRTFPGLPHRMESVAFVEGVEFINDSKATNADAAARALSSFADIFWIAGGRAKDGGYAPLDPYLGNVRRAYLIGEAAEVMTAALAGRVETTIAGDLEAAMSAAFKDATLVANSGRHPVILLSPACASFDQFNDYEHRGETFRALAQVRASKRGAA
jgi:UDP-N-acetylmuramoylalanine--D-glutamate ligase